MHSLTFRLRVMLS